MGYQALGFRSFGKGLNLTAKADAVSEEEAIDLLNVVFTETGAVQQRDGYAKLTSSAVTNQVDSMIPYYTTSGTTQLVLGCDTRLDTITTAGAATGTPATGLTSGTWGFARFGTPTAERVYAGQGDQTLRYWDGAVWTNVANSPQGGALAVTPRSNRLVVGRFNGTAGGPTGGAGTSSPSHVYFSDAGDPATYGTNNFIRVAPGDGEKVTAVISWREFTFIFKESRFWVITGENQDATGQPVFNYDPVDMGVGCVSPRAVCADETGVYFMHRTGVYRTTGFNCTKVSSAIDPIFLGAASSFYTGGVLNHGQITKAAMWAHNKRIYLGFPASSNTTNNRVLVFDPVFGSWWTLWDIPAACGATMRVGSAPELVFGYAAGTKDVGRMSATDGTYTADDGTAITSRWRSGWFDYGSHSTKRIRESKVWGSGVVAIGKSADWGQATGSLVALNMADPTASTWGGTTWGGSTWADPDVLNPAMDRSAVRGTVFSTSLFNQTLNQVWQVHRADHHLAGTRKPSTEKTET